jgi:uncharacterized protein GlcG (DUF336 family)
MSRPFLAALAVATLLAGSAEAQLVQQKALSYQIARTIAEGAMESCTAKGYRVSVVVVGREGETIIAFRGDGSSPFSMENARRKAYTARSYRQPTSAYAKRYAENDPLVRQQLTLPNMIAIPGGLPIKAGEDVIGGAGVSGSPGVDEPCVQAGLDKVADQLK